MAFRINEIDKSYNIKELCSYTGYYFIDLAIYDDYMLLVNSENNIQKGNKFGAGAVNYNFKRLDLNGNLVKEIAHIVPRTIYTSVPVNIDINDDGKVYVLRYIEPNRGLFSSPSKVVAVDVYGSDLEIEETFFVGNEEEVDYILFFQITEEENGYKIYSNYNMIEVEPHNKNIYGAFMLSSIIFIGYTIILNFIWWIIFKKKRVESDGE